MGDKLLLHVMMFKFLPEAPRVTPVLLVTMPSRVETCNNGLTANRYLEGEIDMSRWVAMADICVDCGLEKDSVRNTRRQTLASG